MERRSLSAVLCALVLSPVALAATYKDVVIRDVPHVEQKPDFCGEACVEMFLRKLGKDIDQDAVFDASGLDPLLGRGCYTGELAAALKRLGFGVGSVLHTVRTARAEQEIEQQWAALHADLMRGVPSIVCMLTGPGADALEHFRLILGYEAKQDQIIYHEPAQDDGAYQRMSRKRLLQLWPLKYERSNWTLVRIPLEPGGRVRALPAPPSFSDADYAQHMMQLRGKIPPKGFTVVLQRPFVVIGDESAAAVRQRALRTVKWATDMLKKAYFAKDPPAIIDVWLFKDKKSYRRHTREVFGDTPTTPFGYYSHEHDALIMNIGTGGGTLVHEMVHAFVASNFPACPAWFNEGLGSLYEQCGARQGRLVGFTNWRLKGLQEAIRAGTVPAFKTLVNTTEFEFYDRDPGTNYAQTRYLCYYLQERGKLRRFYREFTATHRVDPQGWSTLKRVLGEDDMAAFKKRWEAFVLKLRFP